MMEQSVPEDKDQIHLSNESGGSVRRSSKMTKYKPGEDGGSEECRAKAGRSAETPVHGDSTRTRRGMKACGSAKHVQ